MKNFLKMAGCAAVMGLFAACTGQVTQANYAVIPAPLQVTETAEGAFTLGGSVKIVYPEGNDAMRRNAEWLATYLNKATGRTYKLKAGAEGKGNILLQLAPDASQPEAYTL